MSARPAPNDITSRLALWGAMAVTPWAIAGSAKGLFEVASTHGYPMPISVVFAIDLGGIVAATYRRAGIRVGLATTIFWLAVGASASFQVSEAVANHTKGFDTWLGWLDLIVACAIRLAVIAMAVLLYELGMPDRATRKAGRRDPVPVGSWEPVWTRVRLRFARDKDTPTPATAPAPAAETPAWDSTPLDRDPIPVTIETAPAPALEDELKQMLLTDDYELAAAVEARLAGRNPSHRVIETIVRKEMDLPLSRERKDDIYALLKQKTGA